MTSHNSILRNSYEEVSQINRRRPPVRTRSVYDTPRNVPLHYEGGPEEHEDLADYLPHGLTVRGTVLA